MPRCEIVPSAMWSIYCHVSNKKVRMKTRVVNTVLISLLLLGALVCLRWPRTVPLGECGEVYRHYVDCDGIDAVYIQDFPINDTLTVGVTLLKAADSAGWAVLQEDFGVPAVPEGYEEYYNDSNRVSMKNYPKGEPLYLNGDTITNDLIVLSRYKQTIAYFVIQSREQKLAIEYKHNDENVNNDIKK